MTSFARWSDLVWGQCQGMILLSLRLRGPNPAGTAPGALRDPFPAPSATQGAAMLDGAPLGRTSSAGHAGDGEVIRLALDDACHQPINPMSQSGHQV